MRYYLKAITLPDTAAVVEEGKPLEGAFTRIVRNQWTDDLILQMFGRRNCCLKVFKRPFETLDDPIWGGNSAIGATIIQNLAAMDGLAPRVYSLVRLCDPEGPGECYLAQVTDFVPHSHGYKPSLRTGLDRFREMNPWLTVKWDMNPKNAKGDMWVDWGIWQIQDPDSYTERLQAAAARYAAWGSRSEPYQSVLGIEGQRDFSSRLSGLGLTVQDVRYRTLLDIGCNLGNFVRWAEEQGARRAWGIDLPHVCAVAREIANWCRCWNADFVDLHLPRNVNCVAEVRDATGEQDFDIVLALAVDRQVGYGLWMRDLTRDMFYLEGHVPDKRETYEAVLQAGWGADNVEFVGTSRDHGPRPLFKCRR